MSKSEKPKPTMAQVLVGIAAENTKLFHTPAGDPYACVPTEDHTEVWPVRSRGFKRWLSQLYYVMEERVPSAQAMTDAMNCLEGMAVYDGPTQDVATRVKHAKDGRSIVIDLCAPDWSVVVVDANGWRIEPDSPIAFRRAKAMLPLPTPTKGGSITMLRDFINVTDEDWPLVAAWLLAAVRPVGPYPVLVLTGEQGSAKSTTARLLRSIVDPNSAPLRCEPKDPRDLMIAANNSWVVALDNLSSLPSWLSDALCRLSTGGGFSTRMLYEDSEEAIFDATRPVVLNGITEVATRSDLLDRAVIINLPRIDEGRRRPESELWEAFNAQAAGIFGALLTAASSAIANLPTTKLNSLPRLADFALWGCAGEAGLELAKCEFITRYSENRADANGIAIEGSAFGRLVLEHVRDVVTWEGTATELLRAIEARADQATLRAHEWPKSGKTAAGIVKRLAPNLRNEGLAVEFVRTKRGRLIRLETEKVGGSASPSSPASPPQENREFWRGNGDAGVTQMTLG